jgi:hypothetical protein
MPDLGGSGMIGMSIRRVPGGRSRSRANSNSCALRCSRIIRRPSGSVLRQRHALKIAGSVMPSPTIGTAPVLDSRQLERIEAVHRGFLFQHLYAAACLLMAAKAGATGIIVERDEDVEIVLPGRVSMCR